MRPFLAVFQDYCIMANIGLKGIDMLILAQIESLNKDGCKCYMTNEGFSKKFGDSESTIKRSLDKLEGLKLIKRKTITNTKGGHASKQRLIIIDEAGFKVALAQALTKVHNDPSSDEKLGSNITKLGSNVDEARFKNDPTKVHNDPIEDKLEEKKIRKKEGLFDSAKADSQSPTPANAGPPAAQPSHTFSFNEKYIIRSKLKSGIKKYNVIKDLKENHNIKITTKELDEIWDEYKGTDGLRKIKSLADQEKSTSAKQANLSAKDNKHYNEVNRLKEILEKIQFKYVDTKITLPDLINVYNNSYEEAKTQIDQSCKHDFTVDQMLKFLNKHIETSQTEINDILTLRKLWNQNRKEYV